MNTKKIPAYVLRLPRKGNFAPLKVGCMESKFIRTKMPKGMEDMWIADGEIFTNVDSFNEMCQRVTPSAYKYKLTAYAFVFEIEVADEKPVAKVEPKAEPKKEVATKDAPSIPLPLPSPPTAKKAAKKAAKKK